MGPPTCVLLLLNEGMQGGCQSVDVSLGFMWRWSRATPVFSFPPSWALLGRRESRTPGCFSGNHSNFQLYYWLYFLLLFSAHGIFTYAKSQKSGLFILIWLFQSFTPLGKSLKYPSTPNFRSFQTIYLPWVWNFYFEAQKSWTDFPSAFVRCHVSPKERKAECWIA